ncbi:uncharacterized protein EV420DRAFT_1120700 [Desarmillaria tabescens]|uniref:Uncharacterized protein n=1 Tax=Armillaria tabescens TaxID=1929756 RepID=A0AA39JEM3_ARMTA|nr:uncharacterized protein EV420DRAFT_1120700 [Desarmillaria tabescens]KAK0441203.1 hypothetical protein EV420DRAFT_1120700 [Desarmillaria tabescens]
MPGVCVNGPRQARRYSWWKGKGGKRTSTKLHRRPRPSSWITNSFRIGSERLNSCIKGHRGTCGYRCWVHEALEYECAKCRIFSSYECQIFTALASVALSTGIILCLRSGCSLELLVSSQAQATYWRPSVIYAAETVPWHSGLPCHRGRRGREICRTTLLE